MGIPAAIALPEYAALVKGAVVGLQWATHMYGVAPTRGDTSLSDV